MKKKAKHAKKTDPDRDTMRSEYDFSQARRGINAKRFSSGTNVAIIDADLLDVFPDAASVNEALHALAPMFRQQRNASRR